jgi:hypothetical protein
LIKFGDIKYKEFLSFIEKMQLTETEILDLESKIINQYGHKYPESNMIILFTMN